MWKPGNDNYNNDNKTYGEQQSPYCTTASQEFITSISKQEFCQKHHEILMSLFEIFWDTIPNSFTKIAESVSSKWTV